jgi:hypothetical protein
MTLDTYLSTLQLSCNQYTACKLKYIEILQYMQTANTPTIYLAEYRIFTFAHKNWLTVQNPKCHVLNVDEVYPCVQRRFLQVTT